MKNNWTKKFWMMLMVLACIGLSACQTADKSKDNKEPIKTEQNNDETKTETDSLPVEADVEGDELQGSEGEEEIVEDEIIDESGADNSDYADTSDESTTEAD